MMNGDRMVVEKPTTAHAPRYTPIIDTSTPEGSSKAGGKEAVRVVGKMAAGEREGEKTYWGGKQSMELQEVPKGDASQQK